MTHASLALLLLFTIVIFLEKQTRYIDPYLKHKRSNLRWLDVTPT